MSQFRIKQYFSPANRFPYVVQWRGIFGWKDSHRGHTTYEEAEEQMQWDMAYDEAGPWETEPTKAPNINPPTWPLPWLWPVLAWPRCLLSRFCVRSGWLPKYDRVTGESRESKWRAALHDWMWNGRPRRLARLVQWFLEMRDGCPRCGHESFSGYGNGWESHVEVVETWDRDTPDGTDHIAAGWEFCARCGHRAWWEEGSL
ncbi:hypothetical protein [Solidesulfovibrio alcoholivorans]|uniref:hypothetical protein n=1 Tax=Solidesulfovibrio alcoholivorans TaxID=81406 RepID=UPI0004961B1B|nr:hypothetical protein [Solidesulfovibrio alcoholivorans]